MRQKVFPAGWTWEALAISLDVWAVTDEQPIHPAGGTWEVLAISPDVWAVTGEQININ